MIRATIRILEGCAVITLRPEGGILSWQDWMSDAVAVLAIRDSGSPAHLGLFSFRTGSVLARFRLPEGAHPTLAEARRYVLVTDELEDDWQTEGTVFKDEPCDLSGEFFEGMRWQMTGGIEEALRSYQKVMAAAPGLPRVRNLAGFCHRLAGNAAEAERLYQAEIERFPGMPDPYANLGALHARENRLQLARSFFEQALERDQFFLPALLQMSRLLSGQGRPPRLAAAINYRLLTGFSDLPPVQEHLNTLAKRSGMGPSEFAVKLRVEAGLVTDPQVLRLMQRLESLRLNGACLASVRGFSLLLEKAQGTRLAGFLGHWVAKRLAWFPPDLPGFLQPALDRALAAMAASHPDLDRTESGGEPGPEATPEATSEGTGGVSREEFYQLILEEILQDGQISPTETALLARLRHALRIDEALHQQLFGRAASFASLPLADGGGTFQPPRFLRKLALAISRDGKVDPQEQKFLELTREVLELPHEALTQALAEVDL